MVATLGRHWSRKFGYSPLYLHYNTGLHISENGQSLATLLETLVEQWPVPVEELAIIGHSMEAWSPEVPITMAPQLATNGPAYLAVSYSWERHITALRLSG